jgi:hypothetical protein
MPRSLQEIVLYARNVSNLTVDIEFLRAGNDAGGGLIFLALTRLKANTLFLLLHAIQSPITANYDKFLQLSHSIEMYLTTTFCQTK